MLRHANGHSCMLLSLINKENMIADDPPFMYVSVMLIAELFYFCLSVQNVFLNNIVIINKLFNRVCAAKRCLLNSALCQTVSMLILPALLKCQLRNSGRDTTFTFLFRVTPERRARCVWKFKSRTLCNAFFFFFAQTTFDVVLQEGDPATSSSVKEETLQRQL